MGIVDGTWQQTRPTHKGSTGKVQVRASKVSKLSKLRDAQLLQSNLGDRTKLGGVVGAAVGNPVGSPVGRDVGVVVGTRLGAVVGT